MTTPTQQTINELQQWRRDLITNPDYQASFKQACEAFYHQVGVIIGEDVQSLSEFDTLVQYWNDEEGY